ncbi:MAG: SoxR reducing system RseC family protein [Spirochaetaceae bacterium]|nr:SoxR reducing system RseC family protein [Spirochaetaceae bacterium]
MSIIGSIQNITGKTVTILCHETALCSGCLNQDCKRKERFITVENTRELPLALGQRVRVKASPSLLVKQISGAFVPPVCSFIAGFITLRRVFPQAGEALAAFCGLVGLFAAAFCVYRFRLRFPAQDDHYTIDRT